MTNPYAPTNAPLRQPPPEERGPRRLPFSGWWPAGFGAGAGLLTDFLVGDFEETILGFYSRRAERAAAQPSS